MFRISSPSKGETLTLTDTDVRSAVGSVCAVICGIRHDVETRPGVLPPRALTLRPFRVEDRVRWQVEGIVPGGYVHPGSLEIASSRAEVERLMHLTPRARAALIRAIVRAWPVALVG